MRKKLLGTIMAVVMLSVMCLNVLAAPSASVNGIVNEIVSAVDRDGNVAEVVITDMPEEYRVVAEEIRNIENVRAVLGDAFIEGMEVVDVREVYKIGDVAFPLTITFQVPGVMPTTNVAVLHYVDGAWQEEPSQAGNGTITATFESLSPVAFVVDKNTSTATVKSPKTGEGSAMAVAGVIVLAAAAGAFMLRRKSL